MSQTDFVFPEVDYAAHPYYAPLLAGISATDRQAVQAKFASVHTDVVAQQRACAEFRSANPGPDGPASAEAATLDREGVLAMRLQPGDLDDLLAVTGPYEARLAVQRAGLTPQQLAIAGASLKISGQGDPPHAFFENLLRRYGVFELCRRHKRLPYALKLAVLQHNTGDDRGLDLVCSFDSTTRARSFYAHIDSAVESMKVIIYLTRDVTAARGAFRYFPGSHRASSQADLAIRKSNDRCGWENVHDAVVRRTFAALPAAFQKKANFGNDLLDPAAAEAVIRTERVLTSADGDLLLFDPDGAHRGAIFEEPGERKIVQLLLVPALRR